MSTRRSSLVGQALVPSLSSTASELAKERSFCNPEDTEEAAAVGRQASACFSGWLKACQWSRPLQVSEHLQTAQNATCLMSGRTMCLGSKTPPASFAATVINEQK